MATSGGPKLGPQGQNAVFKRVVSPGCRPQPFMRPAAARGREFIRTMAAKILARVLKEGKTFAQAAEVIGQMTAEVVRQEAVRRAPVRKQGGGRLRGDISIQRKSQFVFTVGTAVFYAKYQEFGTGIYGPRQRQIVIVPKNKKALAFVSSKIKVPIGRRGSNGRRTPRPKGRR